MEKTPTSSEDINDILQQLRIEKNTTVINDRLARLIIYLRTEKELRSSKTSEGDNVVAQIEPNMVEFLESYQGNFEDIYPFVREMIEIIPKPVVFGIDIAELREDAAFYHENRFDGDPFFNVAGEIRTEVHRRLSHTTISHINDLIHHLNSDQDVTFIAGQFCEASREQKEKEKNSELFQVLLQLKKKLKLVWNDPFTKNSVSGTYQDEKSGEAEEFLQSIDTQVAQLVAPYRTQLEQHTYGREFLDQLNQNLNELQKGPQGAFHIGDARYYLKNLILNWMKFGKADKGQLVFHLMTLDSILENVAFLYYANTVNTEFTKIDNTNYERAIEILIDLVFCCRAVGQGTKTLGCFVFPIKDKIMKEKLAIKKGEIQYIIAEMNAALAGYIFQIRNTFAQIILSSGKFDQLGMEEPFLTNLLNNVINGVIREKTTHLLANLLHSLREYFGRLDKETAEQIAKAVVRAQEYQDPPSENEPQLLDMFFQFGPDIESPQQTAKSSWFMGGKGASLAEACRLLRSGDLVGVDIPKGFGLSTETWVRFGNNPADFEKTKELIRTHVADLEQRTGKRFGSGERPLLLAARSGAIVSMPGILATIAHIGLNEEIVKKWAETLPEPCFAYHAYIRLLFNFAEIIFHVPQNVLLEKVHAHNLADLCVDDIHTLETTVAALHTAMKESNPTAVVPSDCWEQLFAAVHAIFQSYKKEDVQKIIALKHIPPKYGTACLIQECLSILSQNDCSGVLFTRDPRTGGQYQMEFVEHQFGEDLVSGRSKPKGKNEFRVRYPEQDIILKKAANTFENRYWHPNDIEFAIREGKVYILQTRRLALTPVAAVVTNYHFYKKGIINPEELIRRTRRIVHQPLLETYLDERDIKKSPPMANGEPVSGGVVVGRIIYNEAKMQEYPDEPIIFLTKSNLPRDVESKPSIKGYISEEGGLTSHAALVSIGKTPCIVGIDWQVREQKIIFAKDQIEEGEFITLDANEGYIYKGQLPIKEAPVHHPDFLKAHADIRRIIAE